MGTRSRLKPERLAEKLRQIRLALGLSQPEMLRRLEAEDFIAYNEISKYELALREPNLIILLRYARVAGILVEVIIDDDLDLPDRLPGPTHRKQIKRQSVPRRKTRR